MTDIKEGLTHNPFVPPNLAQGQTPSFLPKKWPLFKSATAELSPGLLNSFASRKLITTNLKSDPADDHQTALAQPALAQSSKQNLRKSILKNTPLISSAQLQQFQATSANKPQTKLQFKQFEQQGSQTNIIAPSIKTSNKSYQSSSSSDSSFKASADNKKSQSQELDDQSPKNPFLCLLKDFEVAFQATYNSSKKQRKAKATSCWPVPLKNAFYVYTKYIAPSSSSIKDSQQTSAISGPQQEIFQQKFY